MRYDIAAALDMDFAKIVTKAQRRCS